MNCLLYTYKADSFQGKKDGTTPAWHSQELGKRIPNARNIRVEGKGRILNWEVPETLIEAIQSFGE